MSAWTDERLAALDAMWAEGLPASRIAEHLGDGVTRFAVIGMAHRRGLPQRQAPTSIAAARAARERKLAGGVELADLDSTTCAWPLGDVGAKAVSFCGRDVADGKPYCPTHATGAYQLPRGRPKYPVAASFRKTWREEH